MALILAAVMAVSCLTTILLAASKNWSSLKDLGALSQYYETGADADPGAVSTVPGDPGGTSFGLYMFSSKAGTLDAFRTWLRNYQGNAIYNGFAATLDKAYGENTSGAAAAGYGPTSKVPGGSWATASTRVSLPTPRQSTGVPSATRP